MPFRFRSGLIAFALIALGWTSSGSGQTPQQTPAAGPEHPSSESPGTAPASEHPLDPPLTGRISGTVVDQSGAVVAGAQVTMTRESLNQQALSGADGEFSFTNVVPGPFRLAVSAAGFGRQTLSGTLHAGEVATVPQIVLPVALNITEVQVGIPQVEVAEEQLKIEEKQRVLGAIPNFYVTYIPNAAPLTSRQKFRLAAKTVVDPFTLVVVAGTAGVQQAQNHFREYGQGVEGYAKRFGAGYADTLTGTFIGGAILPSLLKQDPRYFYKGTGSVPYRFLYAIASSVICKGDNRRWQANYSNILGSLAAGGISNLYYPSQDREGLELTFENAAIGIGSTALTNLLQEFVIRRLTPKLPNHDSGRPQQNQSTSGF